MSFWRRNFGELELSWKVLRDYGLILLGAFIQALAMRLFLIPADLVSGGISGAGQIINSYTHWPIGLMVFIGNLPLFILGWRYLGGSRFAFRTAVAVAAFSLFTDNLVYFLPQNGSPRTWCSIRSMAGSCWGWDWGWFTAARGRAAAAISWGGS